MIKAITEEQRRHIERMFPYSDIMYALVEGVRVDSYISYEQMKAIVSYLEKTEDTPVTNWVEKAAF